MEKQHNKSIILVWCIFFLFAISTFVKVNFSAAIAYFVKEGIFTKTNSGTIVAAFYLIYGTGQIVGAKYMLKFSPFRLVAIGLLLSAVTNFSLCFATNFASVLILWSINGLANCVMWPTAVRIVADYINGEDRRMATKMLTLSVAVGGISSYVVTSPVLEAFGQMGMFIMNASIMIVMLVYWAVVYIKTDRVLLCIRESAEQPEKKESEIQLGKLLLSSGVMLVLVIVTIRAMIDNGLKTWIPTMMIECYSVSTTWGSLLTAAIYLCNIAGVFILTPLVYRIKNEVSRYIVLFSVVLPFTIIMVWVGKAPMMVVTCSFVIISCITYFMNEIAVSMPARFAEKGFECGGSIGSLINGFGSIGVLLASMGFGYIAENFDWQTVIVCCIVLTVSALVLSLAATYLWTRFLKSER